MPKLWPLLISPLVIVLGFYFFLIGANYYYANRAAYLLERIRALQLDNSSIAELRHLGLERGFRYEEGGDCTSRPCIYMVKPNNQWMWFLFRSPSRAKVGEHLGLRPWVTAGDIEIENGAVIGKVYGVGFYEGQIYPEIEAAAWEVQKLDITPCMYFPLKRHPGYAFTNADNIRSFTVWVSDLASAENRNDAFQFNLKCLTHWHRCNQFSEIMPMAWVDYEEDGKWSETHPRTGCGITLHTQ